MTSRPSKCDRCKATVPPNAEWCPVCFKPFRVPDRARSGEPRASTRSPISDRRSEQREAMPDLSASPKPHAREAPAMPEDPAPAVWPCPECEHRNAMELDACEICGTPFGQLFQEPKLERHVDPRAAFRASLLLPGLGHIRSGRTPEGIARMLLFLWAAGTGLVLVFARASGLPVFGALFVAAAVAVYVVSAMEAPRMAEGGPTILPSRALLWGSTALAFLSIMSVFVVMMNASNGG